MEIRDILLDIAKRLETLEEKLSRGDMFPEVMDIKECSAFLHCSERTVRELVSRGKIPFYRLDSTNGKSKLLFNKRKILLWLETGKTTFSKRDRTKLEILDD